MPEPIADPGSDQTSGTEADRADTERLVFFSDAVLAIALTLLAIDLPLPPQGSSSEMLRAAGEDWPEYLAFLISFAVIGSQWRLHHQVFSRLDRAPPLLIRLNQSWLLVAVVTPFLTRLLSTGQLNAVRFVPYALAQLLQCLLMAVMIAVIRRRGLSGDPTRSARLTTTLHSSVGLAVSFAISVPLYFLAGSWAFAAWAVVPQLSRLLRRVRAARHGRRETSAEQPPHH